MLIAKANHYGVNNFISQDPNQRPLCSLGSFRLEDQFTTTKETQTQVVKTIAKVTNFMYREGLKGKGVDALFPLVDNQKLLIEKIDLL